jgi:hypothetical protein
VQYKKDSRKSETSLPEFFSRNTICTAKLSPSVSTEDTIALSTLSFPSPVGWAYTQGLEVLTWVTQDLMYLSYETMHCLCDAILLVDIIHYRDLKVCYQSLYAMSGILFRTNGAKNTWSKGSCSLTAELLHIPPVTGGD